MTTKPIEATSLRQLEQTDDFIHRHIGPSPSEIQAMLETVGADSLDDLIESTVPASILLDTELDLPASSTEHKTIERLQKYADANVVNRSMIGMGYYGTHAPT